MTEDEAFVRTIVDSPGDDLPRLVYADWLDDRGDPRGAYLRAEVEWAKAKRTAGFMLLRLNGLAEGLDPVWVARVSRPPVGVCCDHLRFVGSPARIAFEEVTEIEDEHDILLPPQHLAFLLNHNGGKPVRDYQLPEIQDIATSNLTESGWWFHPLKQDVEPEYGWTELSIRGAMKLREFSLSRASLPYRSWYQRFLQLGKAPPLPHRYDWNQSTILLLLEGELSGHVWLSNGRELEDRDFDEERPPGLRPLSQLLSEIH